MSRSDSETSLLAELLPENITVAVSSALGLTEEQSCLFDNLPPGTNASRREARGKSKAPSRSSKSGPSGSSSSSGGIRVKAEKTSPGRDGCCCFGTVPQPHRMPAAQRGHLYGAGSSSLAPLGGCCSSSDKPAYLDADDVFLPANRDPPDAICEGTLDFPSPGKLVRAAPKEQSSYTTPIKCRKRRSPPSDDDDDEPESPFAASYPDNPVGQWQLWLDNRWLWDMFYANATEMVITKSGRRMFPYIIVAVRGLNPAKQYSMHLRIAACDPYRYKYQGGEWASVGKAADGDFKSARYVHRDSPAVGAHWQKNPVVFKHIKVTNNKGGNPKHLVLQSMHKYVAQVIVEEQDTKIEEVFTFEETAFIAVTAYQNEEVKDLKVDYNPYARAFREKIEPDSPSQSPRMGGHAKKMKEAKFAEEVCQRVVEQTSGSGSGLATSRPPTSSSATSSVSSGVPRDTETPPLASPSITSLESGYCGGTSVSSRRSSEASRPPSYSTTFAREPLWSSNASSPLGTEVHLPTSEEPVALDDALRRPGYWDGQSEYDVVAPALTELDSFSPATQYLPNCSPDRSLEPHYGGMHPLHVSESMLALERMGEYCDPLTKDL